MIPYQVDPSLHTERPAPPRLDDGFSPPAGDASAQPQAGQVPDPVQPPMSTKSEF